MANNGDEHRPASRYLIAVAGNILPPLASIVTAPVLANALGVVGRGELAAATAPLLFAVAISTLGLPEAVVFAVSRSPGVARVVVGRALLPTILLGVVATGLVVLASGSLAAGNASIQLGMLVASIAILPSLASGLLRGAAMGLNQWRTVTFSRVLDAGFRLVALLSLWATGSLTLLSATMVIAFAPLIGGLVFVVSSFRREQMREREHSADSSPSKLLNYGSRIWIGSLSGVLLSRVDQLLMVPLSGAIQLGLYAVAVSLSEIPLIVNSAVREVVFVSDAMRQDDAHVTLASRLSTLVTFAMAVAMAGLVPLLLGPLFGWGFVPALPAFWVLLIAVVLGNPGSVAGASLSARGHPGLRSASLAVACTLNVIVLIFLVPTLGAMGAALATLLGNLVASNINILLLWRIEGTNPLHFYLLRAGDIVVLLREMGRVFRRRPGPTDPTSLPQ